ncbi:hypothetical protein EDD15DRAFT_2197939 [Pisolithus albus]|nr:hypothetical protein EDD15DRAFT_2197939 [Pisolithus albus]
MHLCLYLDEILREIFRCIESCSTLCVLARTCRAFRKPATDQIWETLTAMEPIFQYLSSTMLVEKGTGSYFALLHPLSGDGWNIIRRFSSRVHRLHITLESNVPSHDAVNDATPQWFCFLASPPDSSFLFPNLRALSFDVDRSLEISGTGDILTGTSQAIIHFFQLLLGSHLSALRFEMPTSFYPHLDISSIPLLCPNIHTLSLGRKKHHCEGILDEVVYWFSGAVSQLRHLETVRSYMASWDLLSSLAEAKGLRKLWVHLPRMLGPRPTRPSGDIFTQLRTLDISTGSLAPCMELLRWTSFKEVTGIYIDCAVSTNDRNSLQTLVDMSYLISSQCQNLDFLWIVFSPYDHREAPTGWPQPMLEPYQAFHQLRVIALQTSRSLTLAGNEFEGMVKAWPHLEVFHLFHDGITSPPVHLTLLGVTTLLYHCPKLKHFTLVFDARGVPEHFIPLFRGTIVWNTSVRYMGTYSSPVSESVDVARYLSILTPYLTAVGVESGAGYGSEWFWMCVRHHQKPAIKLTMSAATIYSVLKSDIEYDNDGDSEYGREWSWKSPRDWNLLFPMAELFIWSSLVSPPSNQAVSSLVICSARPRAPSRAEPSRAFVGWAQAEPLGRPVGALGPASGLAKPEPSPQKPSQAFKPGLWWQYSSDAAYSLVVLCLRRCRRHADSTNVTCKKRYFE